MQVLGEKGTWKGQDRYELKQRWRVWPKAYLAQVLRITELNKTITNEQMLQETEKQQEGKMLQDINMSNEVLRW